MNIILLSGGSGKRLWPLSNDIRSKQFIKILKKSSAAVTEDDEYESMVQRIYHQIHTVDPDAKVMIATSKSQVSTIHNQLEGAEICVEPCRRDTFAAIALAAAYLHDVQGMERSEAVAVCPVDPYVEDDYFFCVQELYRTAKEGKSNLVLMGIKPTYPSEKYGYIIPDTNGDYNFTEKPDEETARKYIAADALWNGGVFACKLSYILSKACQMLGTDSYEILFNSYSSLEKISFDYAVVEREKSLSVITYNGIWKDLGTWNMLTEAMEEHSFGEVIQSDSCDGTHVLNELGIPILAMGCKNLVVCASADGILVSDKHESSFIKPYVDAIDHRVMYAEKSWGSYRVLDVGEASMTVKVTLNPEHKMNYHSHTHRDEVWTVIKGSGTTIVDDLERRVKQGDVVMMNAGCRHTVIAGKTGIQLIEVQLGPEISVSDKKKHRMPQL